MNSTFKMHVKEGNACAWYDARGRCSNGSVRERVALTIKGVAGAGKTTVATTLAEALRAEYIDADDLHSAAAIHKLAHGTPLIDQDRWPWLERVRSHAASAADRVASAPYGVGVVVACSALRRIYRDVLRAAPASLRIVHVYLRVDPAELAVRLAQRQGHFMKCDMLESQLATLEEPCHECDTFTIVVPPGEDAASTMQHILAALIGAGVVWRRFD